MKIQPRRVSAHSVADHSPFPAPLFGRRRRLSATSPSGRAEAIENCRFTMIQIWAGGALGDGSSACSRFAHHDDLQCSSRNTVKVARAQARNHTGTEPHFLGSQSNKRRSGPWASAIRRFKRRCLERDGNTRPKNKAGRGGKAHAPTAGLSYLQAQIPNSKPSMSSIALLASGCPELVKPAP